MAEQERCPECGYPQPDYNRDPCFDCVCTGDSNCDGRALRRAKSELATARKALAAAEEMRAAGTAGVWSQGKYQPTEEAAAFDAAMAEVRKGLTDE